MVTARIQLLLGGGGLPPPFFNQLVNCTWLRSETGILRSIEFILMIKITIWKDVMRAGLILALIITASANVRSQTAGTPAEKQTDPAMQTTGPKDQTGKTADPAKQKQKTAKKPKRGNLVIAPIPVSSPAVGSGVVLVVGYVFKLNQQDKLSRPSVVGLAAAYTNSGSRGGGIAGRLYFDQNKYQTTFAVAKGRVNYDFFGIGRIPGQPEISVLLHQGGVGFFGEFMRNTWKNIFVGPRFSYRNLFVRLGGEQTPGGFVIPDIDIKSKTVALGAHIQRDLRDSNFYPTKGSLADIIGDFFAKPLGSKRTYQVYKLSYNGYRTIAPKQIIAYQAMTCSANGSVPFYDLCFYGTNNQLRGYTGGEFQNRRMFATQAEYRRELPKRFGFVAFGGIGGVARTWGEFRSDGLLPAAGAGLRFKLDKKNHINYRIDWAVGRAGHTLTLGVMEAF
jgi:hypothetical protein